MGQGFSIRSFFGQSWWVLALLAIVYLFYLQSIKQKKIVIAKLDAKIETIDMEMRASVDRQKDLKLQIQSQSDPAWIEMTLMKELGVTGQGQQKVLFRQ